MQNKNWNWGRTSVGAEGIKTDKFIAAGCKEHHDPVCGWSLMMDTFSKTMHLVSSCGGPIASLQQVQLMYDIHLGYVMDPFRIMKIVSG